MGIEKHTQPAHEEPREKAKFGEYFGPLGFQRPSPGPLDRLVKDDAPEMAEETGESRLARLTSLIALLEERTRKPDDRAQDTEEEGSAEEPGEGGREHPHEHDSEKGEDGHEHLHEHEDRAAGHRHTHGHTHSKENEKIYASHYEPTPEDMVTGSKREQQFLKGLGWGFVAVGLWAVDALVHLSPIPFDDVVVHSAAILCTLRALGPLNAGWRGYRIPEEIIKGRKEEYEGEGYPVSSITYARENLRGYYDEGSVKRQYSRYAIGIGFIGKAVGGMVHETAHDISGIWGYGESSHREEGIGGFIKYTVEGIGRLAKNLYDDGPPAVLGKMVRTVGTIIPSLTQGLVKGNRRFLQEYKAGGINPNLRES